MLEVWRTGIGYQLQHPVVRQTRLERTRGAGLDMIEAIQHSTARAATSAFHASTQSWQHQIPILWGPI